MRNKKLESLLKFEGNSKNQTKLTQNNRQVQHFCTPPWSHFCLLNSFQCLCISTKVLESNEALFISLITHLRILSIKCVTLETSQSNILDRSTI